ncbi:MAG: lipopolysaccharide kinase InaA family protein [Lentisphaeria bacterium]|nr:lipopolysaccharide kinase InaA family protein [Lentisphaeria bacterium]
MQESQKIIIGRWKGLVREGWQSVFADIHQLADSGEVIVDKPDRVVRRIETPNGVVYFKRICGAGTGRGWYFLKSLLRTPRSLAIWHVSEQMRLADLGCPLPLLAVSSCCFSSCRFEDILVTAEIPYSLVSDLLKDAADNAVREGILQKAGQGIRELHDKGFVHGDCLPGNICMGPDGKLIFLDNDRTAKKIGIVNRGARLQNLVQFCSHALTALPNQALLDTFLDSYDQHGTCNANARNCPDKETVIRKLQARVRKLEKEFGKKFLGCKLNSNHTDRVKYMNS